MKLLVVCLLVLAVPGALGQKYYGVNEAALGWGASAIPGVAGTNFPLISNASLDYFAAKGMNTIRVSITWERLQPTLYGSFDSTYVGYITNSVNYITNVKGMYCLLDLHNYHRYRDNVIGSSAVPYYTITALTDVWAKLATLYKSNARMLWGTMNEPYGVGYLAAQLGANAAIKGIRDAGATQLITISGNDYSAVYSWVGTNSLYMGPANITDPLNNYHYELHQYFDGQGGNTVCISTYDIESLFGATTTWARTNGVKLFLGEFGINDSDACLQLLNKLMTFLKANADVWNGWTWWAAGPWWAEDYVYLLEPKADGSDRNRLMTTLKTYFPTAFVTPSSSPTRSPTVSPTRTFSASPTRSPTASPTRTPAVSPTRTPSASPTRTPTASPTRTPTRSPTATPTRTPTSSPTRSATPSPKASPSSSPKASVSASPKASSTPALSSHAQYKGDMASGVNEAALVWGASAIPGVAGTNFPLISNASLDYFAAKGMNTIRVSIIWERLQPTLYGDFDWTYANYLINSVNYITNVKGMYCVIDLHNYHRYNGQLLGSSAVPYYTITNVWYRLAGVFLHNQRVIFGTMNEPYGVPYIEALKGANAAISGIRDVGATQPITISGTDFSAVNTWVGSNSLWMGPANITDPLNNYMYEMHQFFDGQGGSTVCNPSFNVASSFGPVTAWARSVGAKVFLGAFGINDSDQCLVLLNTLMSHLNANADVWYGWTWWTAGPWLAADYVYLLEPKADGSDPNRLMATLQNYFPKKV